VTKYSLFKRKITIVQKISHKKIGLVVPNHIIYKNVELFPKKIKKKSFVNQNKKYFETF